MTMVTLIRLIVVLSWDISLLPPQFDATKSGNQAFCASMLDLVVVVDGSMCFPRQTFSDPLVSPYPVSDCVKESVCRIDLFAMRPLLRACFPIGHRLVQWPFVPPVTIVLPALPHVLGICETPLFDDFLVVSPVVSLFGKLCGVVLLIRRRAFLG